MIHEQLEQRLRVAEAAARRAGAFLKDHFETTDLQVDEHFAHDLKIRLDKDTQALIEGDLLAAYPHDSFLGEEWEHQRPGSDAEWIVDPIDGTVNFFYGLPLFCVSIALRFRGELLLGCVYDPMRDECFKAIKGGKAYCNDRPLHASRRDCLADAIVFVGHGRHDQSGEAGMARFARISAQVRKMRIFGSAALSLCYIAAGRMDAYIEQTLSIWDFAGAQVILEAAGGGVQFTPRDAQHRKGQIVAWNGLLPLHEVL